MKRAQRCEECLAWGLLRDRVCPGCQHWENARPGRDTCRLCRHQQCLSIDGLCRNCLISLRRQGLAPDATRI